MNNKIEKWKNTIESIEKDVWFLLNFQSTYFQLVESLPEESERRKNILVFDFIFYSYVAWACMAIRRLTEINSQGFTLVQLLKDISANPKHLSRSYYKKLYAETIVKEFSDRDFDRFVVNNGEHISPENVELDIKKLITIYNTFEGINDKVIAHKDKVSPKDNPTWNTLSESINEIEKITIKYIQAIKATGRTSLHVEQKIGVRIVPT